MTEFDKEKAKILMYTVDEDWEALRFKMRVSVGTYGPSMTVVVRTEKGDTWLRLHDVEDDTVASITGTFTMFGDDTRLKTEGEWRLQKLIDGHIDAGRIDLDWLIENFPSKYCPRERLFAVSEAGERLLRHQMLGGRHTTPEVVELVQMLRLNE